VIGGVERKIHCFGMDLPHSECRLRAGLSGGDDGGILCRSCRGVRFFGGVPLSILYDNTKLAVARILGDGTRLRARAFSELQSHYLFAELRCAERAVTGGLPPPARRSAARALGVSVSANLGMCSLGEETRVSCRGPANYNAVALILPHKARA
jgi:hypothetical protein